MADVAAALRPVGSAQDAFVLMLHDRILELERSLAALAPKPVDPRIRLLGKSEWSDNGAAFVRVRSPWGADTAAVAGKMLQVLGDVDPTRWDAWVCQHWSCLLDSDPYVVEILVQRGGSGGVDVVRVAHAALDAVRALADGADASVEACGARCPAWFIESIRTAGHATGRAVAHAWDPATRAASTAEDPPDAEHPADAEDPADASSDSAGHKAWTMLHGWMASQVELTDVWHPRALNAAANGQELGAALRRLTD